MGYVNYDKKGKIAFILLNRPKMNLINFEMVLELDNIWKDFEDDTNLWIAVLGSTGDNFTAGFDINEIRRMLTESDYLWKKSSMFGEKCAGPDGHSVMKPVIAILSGVVNGLGMWLTLQSDIRIATPEASFGLSEGKLNFPVEFTALLTRYMPRAVINELLFMGKNFSAQRFYDLGIINKIVEREQLMEEAVRTAETICEMGPISIRVMKQLLNHSYDMDFRSLMALTASMIVPVVNSKDTKEALTCFIEKRKPQWKIES
jgi:enoyl-CoA hydratase/carnithine racemase